MAKYYKGILGPISGKIGELVFSSINGVNYVRRVAKHTHKTPSTKQLIQRKKFGIVRRFLSPLRFILDESYRKINSKASGLHTAAKQILAEAIIGEYPDLKIDFSRVSLIRGHLGCNDIEMSYDEKSSELRLSWPYTYQFNSFLNDELFALIYCPSLPQTWHQVKTGILRSEQISCIKLPGQLCGHKIHIWLAFQSEMMGSFSNSKYMGNVFTQKPDRHEHI